MKIQPYITFDIPPMAVAKKPRQGTSLRYEAFLKYKLEIAAIAKGKRFRLTDNFKIVFILPVWDKHTPQEQMALVGQPHTTGKHSLLKLTEAFRQALDPTDRMDVYRVDASKYWGEKGKILVRNNNTEDFEFLRKNK